METTFKTPELIKMISTFGRIDFLKIGQFARGKRNLESNLLDRLYQYFSNEIPYSAAKAVTIDPDEWVLNKLKQIFRTDKKW